MKLTMNAIGHLGRDASIKHFENGQSAINFSMACTEKYKDKTGQLIEHTTWIECTIWRKSDKLRIAEYLLKGQLVDVVGRPEARGFKSKTNPDQINGTLMLRVDGLVLLGTKIKETPSTTTSTQNLDQAIQNGNADDDLPF